MQKNEWQKGEFSPLQFTQLFWRICRDGETGILRLKRHQIEKSIHFHAGVPTFVESNLLHETIAQSLIKQNLITTEQQQEALLQSIEKGQRIGSALIGLGFIDAMTFYKALKKNQATKILDCFRWNDGTFDFDSSASPNRDLALKMNPYRLLLHGVTSVMPFKAITKQELLDTNEQFRIADHTLPKWTENQLGTNEIRILNLLKAPINASDLALKLDSDVEVVTRKIFAFFIMEVIIQTSEALPAPANTIKKAPPAQKAIKQHETIKRPTVKQEQLTRLYLRLSEIDYFELLQLSNSATATEVRSHFLNFSMQYNPANFVGCEETVVDQAEAIFLKGVEAYGVLQEYESKRAYLEKLRLKSESSRREKTKNQFTIQTKLLDASSQYEDGIKLLRSGSYVKAAEHFEFAHNIDPKPTYLAYLGWSRFMNNPADGIMEIKEAHTLEPGNAEITQLFKKVQNQTAQSQD